eukprot:Opistho-1_new@105646
MADSRRSDHARLDHDGAQAGELAVDEFVEGRAAQQGCRPAVLLHRFGPALALGGLDDHLGQGLALLGRDARGRIDAAPIADLDIDAQFLQSRRVQALDALGRGDGDGAHFAALDVLLELAEAAAAHGHIAAQDGGNRLATAPEGHVVDLGRIDADLAGDHGCRDVLGGAARTATPLDAAGVLLHLLDHVLHGLERRDGRQHEDVVLADQACDRRGLREAHRWLAGDDAAQHHRAHHQQRIRVALAGVDELGQAQRTGRTALVLVLHRGRHAGILQGLAQGPARGVPAATRIGRDHHLHIGAGLGRQGPGARSRQGGDGLQKGVATHACLQFFYKAGQTDAGPAGSERVVDARLRACGALAGRDGRAAGNQELACRTILHPRCRGVERRALGQVVPMYSALI